MPAPPLEDFVAKTDPPPDAAPPSPPPAAESAPQAYLFVGTQPKTYLFPGAGPQSAQYGDVCALPYDPGDGRWQKTGAPVTRLPDNHPDQVAKDQAANDEARAKLLASPPYAPQSAAAPADGKAVPA